MLIRFKACVVCKGDLVDERDEDADYQKCIQCGRFYNCPKPKEGSDFVMVKRKRSKGGRHPLLGLTA